MVQLQNSLLDENFVCVWSLPFIRLERLFAPKNATSLNINYLYLDKHS